MTINCHTTDLIRALDQGGNQFRADDKHSLARFLEGYFRDDEDGWRSEFAPAVDLDSVDWPLVAAVLS